MRRFCGGRRKSQSTDPRSERSVSGPFAPAAAGCTGLTPELPEMVDAHSSSICINYAKCCERESERAQTPLEPVKFIFVWPHINFLTLGQSEFSFCISNQQSWAPRPSPGPSAANTRLINDTPLRGTTSSTRALQSVWHRHKSTQMLRSPSFLVLSS